MCAMADLFVLPRRSAPCRNRTTGYWVECFSWFRECKLSSRGQADFTGVRNFATHTQVTIKNSGVFLNFRLLSGTYTIHTSF